MAVDASFNQSDIPRNLGAWKKKVRQRQASVRDVPGGTTSAWSMCIEADFNPAAPLVCISSELLITTNEEEETLLQRSGDIQQRTCAAALQQHTHTFRHHIRIMNPR